jgi:putative DNA primase/helicase
MPDVIEDFKRFIAGRGLIVDQLDADGRLHRCSTVGGKSGRKDGSYLLHLDGVPAGGADNWRDGLGWQTWCAKSGREFTAEERQAWHAQAVAIRAQRADDEATRYAEAAKRAARLLHQAKQATNEHPYLVRKGVGAYGLRQLREQLVIPVRDGMGNLTSLQFISPAGEKRFLTGGRKRGCYFPIGMPRNVLCLAEGYATAASIFEATGHATAVAFDAGNLEPVARLLRGKFPDISIIVCADDDSERPGNPGVSYAIKAAQAVRGRIAIPRFGGVAA